MSERFVVILIYNSFDMSLHETKNRQNDLNLYVGFFALYTFSNFSSIAITFKL